MVNGTPDLEFEARILKEGFKRDLLEINRLVKKGGADAFNIAQQMAVEKKLAAVNRRLKEMQSPMYGIAQIMPKQNAQFKEFGDIMGDIDKKIKPGRIQFAGYAMSIMFFGMALQQMSLQVMRFGSKAFNEVMHSVEGTVTQMDYLNSSMAYLGFTLGQAFEPVLAWIIPIIDTLAEWVINNEETARTIGVIGVVAGTVFAVGGAAVLALNGFIELFTKLGVVTLDANGKITNLGATMKSLGGVIAIGFAVKNATDAFKDLESGEWANGMFNALSAGLLAVGGYKLMKGKGGGWLIALGLAANSAANDRFFQDTVGMFTRLVAAIMAIAMWLGAELAQALADPMSRALASVLEAAATAFKMVGMNSFAKGLNQAADAIRSAGSAVSDLEPTMQDYMSMVMNGGFVKSITDFSKNADKGMASIDAPSQRQQVNFNGNMYMVSMPAGMSPTDPQYFDTVLAYLKSSGQIN